MLLSGKTAFYALMQSLMLYLIVSLTTALGFFMLKNSETSLRMLTLRDLISLKKSNIFLTLIIVVGFFSAAGIPPFLGFFQKYLILLALAEKMGSFLMLFLILSSILPAYYYIRISKILLFMPKNKHILIKTNTNNTCIIISIIFISIFGIVL